jgi:hypothetical protein
MYEQGSYNCNQYITDWESRAGLGSLYISERKAAAENPLSGLGLTDDFKSWLTNPDRGLKFYAQYISNTSKPEFRKKIEEIYMETEIKMNTHVIIEDPLSSFGLTEDFKYWLKHLKSEALYNNYVWYILNQEYGNNKEHKEYIEKIYKMETKLSPYIH